MLKTVTVAVASFGLFGCDMVGDAEEVGQADLAATVKTATLAVDSTPESAMIVMVPAANVAGLVPAGYTLLTIPGGAEGADGALLWMFSGHQSNVTLDGEPAGTDHLVHTAVQILEPPPPPGQTLIPGAAHLYEVRLIFDNNTVASWGHSRVGEAAIYSNGMHYSQQDPGEGAGFVSMTVDPPWGGFSYFIQYGPLAPAPAPVAYTWYEGDHGLSFGSADFQQFQASGAGGQICADPGTWVGDILGVPCRSGGGLAFTAHAVITWTVYFPEDDI